MLHLNRQHTQVLSVALLFGLACALVLSGFANAATASDLPAASNPAAAATAEAIATPPVQGASLANEPKRLGMEAYEKNDLKKAAELLTNARELDPKDPEIAGRLGFALKETGGYEKAAEALNAAIEMKPQEFYYWWWLSDTQRLLGQYDAAVKSIEQARDLAPKDNTDNLQAYVDYSVTLASGTASWTNVAQHLDFANRHQKNRRIRRQIAELARALTVAPAVEDGNKEGLGKIAYINGEMGTLYNYIEEPEVALDYFLSMLPVTIKGDFKGDTMRCHENLATSYRMIYEKHPEKGGAPVEMAVTHLREALNIAKELNDLVHARYSQGRLLNAMILVRPMGDADLVTTRAENMKEVPWQGPINEFSVAEAVAAEMACRMKEGDLAGARVMVEMALPYYEQSTYLTDYQRAIQLYLTQSQINFLQQHAPQAMEAAEKAAKKAVDARQYVDADSFNRGSGEQALREIALAMSRALNLTGDQNTALKVIETSKHQSLLNLLASKITSDVNRTDAASERQALRQRVPLLEERLATAQAASDANETARLELRLGQDRKRLAWLDRDVSLSAPEKLGYQAPETLDTETLCKELPEDLAVVHYLFDDGGGVAVVTRRDTVTSVLLHATAQELLIGANEICKKTMAEAQPMLDAIGAKICTPLQEALAGVARVVICADAPSSRLPFAALTHAGKSWGDLAGLSMSDSLTQLSMAYKTEQSKPARLRALMAREDRPELLAAETPGIPPLIRFAGAEATPGALVADAQQTDLIHVACLVDTTIGDVSLSPLMLAGPEGQGDYPPARLLGEKLPGLLLALDWAPATPDMEWRAEFFPVLSESARHAGCPSLLTTLWPMDASVAKAFFDTFYARCGEVGRGQALKEGQTAVRTAFPDRLDWAAFILRGDPR